jgi:hypothetical protein
MLGDDGLKPGLEADDGIGSGIIDALSVWLLGNSYDGRQQGRDREQGVQF